MDEVVPKLSADAALKAMEDWGRPKSDITHLIFCSSGGASMPSADYDFIRLLGLLLFIKRFMLYQQGCFGGGIVLCLTKDLAENNHGARVSVVSSEVTSISFRGPCEDHIENLVGQTLFGDGATAVLVGVELKLGVENALGKLREVGLMFSLQPKIPAHISASIERLVGEVLRPLGITDWNEAFWVVHPGGRAIIDVIEEKLGLSAEKLASTREALRDYGNMWSACVLFVMEGMRRGRRRRGWRLLEKGWSGGFSLGSGLASLQRWWCFDAPELHQ